MAKKKTKSRNHTGHIRQLENGLWEGQFCVNGERGSIYAATNDALISALGAEIGRRKSSEYKGICKDSLTYWLDEWLKKYSKVRPSTVTTYDGYIRNHLSPYIGHKPLRKITTPVLQRHFNTLSEQGGKDKKGLSDKSVWNIRVMLHRALEQARILGKISANPVVGIEINTPLKKKKDVLQQSEVDKLIDFCRSSSSLVAKATIILLKTGLRIGELLGLTWDTVDFTQGSITINKTLERLNNKTVKKNSLSHHYTRVDFWASFKNKTGLYLGPPKSEKGNRTLFLHELALEAIHDFQLYQKELIHQGSLTPNSFNPNRFVICDENGRPYSAEHFRSVFYRLLDSADSTHIVPHGLRHTFCTIASSKSGNWHVLQEVMGHANIATTMSYGNPYEEDKKKLMQVI